MSTLAQEASLPADSSLVPTRLPSAETIAAYIENPEFVYSKQQILDKSIREQFWDWLRSMLPEVMDDEGWSLFSNFLTYGIAACILLFAAFQLLNMKARNFLSVKNTAIPMPAGETLYEKSAADWKALAGEAIEQERFRDGIRLYYLYALHLLDASGAIEWKAWKTNRDYLTECTTESVAPHFRRMTYLFDYAWYGNFSVSASIANEASSLASDIEASIGARP